jgi:hypothetical protein
MGQVVSLRPLTAEARVRAQINPCGICGRQSGTGIGFSPSSSVFPCQCIIPRHCDLVVSVEDYKHRGPGFYSRELLRIFLRELGLERGPLSLVIR